MARSFSIGDLSWRPSAYVEDYSIDVQIGVLALVCRHEDRKRR